jgi:hypothetical protein
MCKREINSPASSMWQQICSGLLEGILDHLSCNIVEHEAGVILTNSVGQAKMFQHIKEN